MPEIPAKAVLATASDSQPIRSTLSEEAPAKSAEQEARELLDRIGIPFVAVFTSGDLVELANLIARDRARSGGNEGSDTPNDRALHRLADLLASSDDHGWSSNGVFSATLPTRSAAREIAEIVDALVDSASTPAPDCTSHNPSPPGMTLT